MYVNEANYEGYKKLYEINTNDIKFYNDKVRNIFIITVGTISISIPLSSLVLLSNMNEVAMISTVIASPFIMPNVVMIIMDLVNEVIKNINYDYLKKDYPNINIDVDNKVLKRELILCKNKSKGIR